MPTRRSSVAGPRRRLTLRAQLTGWVAAVLLISFAVLFAVVFTDTEHQLVGQLDRQLAADTRQLGGELSRQPAQGVLPVRIRSSLVATVHRYFASQRYGVSSPLLFVLIPGGPPLANHPELFSQGFGDDGESNGEQGREDAQGQRLAHPVPGYSTARVPDVGRVRLLERSASFGATRLIIGAGLPLNGVEEAQHAVGRAFLLFGIAVLALALLASYLAGIRVSAPLRRMAAVARRVDAGDLGPRIGTLEGSSEMQVLAESFDHMLERLTEAFTQQREFVADASHELRTPITVIRGQLELLAAGEPPTGEEVRRTEQLVGKEIDRITRLVDDLLLLAQSGRTDFLHPAQIDLPSFLADLWEGIAATADRRFEVGPLPAGRLRADPDRLAQALRNLARNAIEHTAPGTGLVRLEAAALPHGRIRFAITDDGPGIPEHERERVFERFHRTDRGRSRARGGAGLGLSIVRAIAEAHGGEARIEDGPAGAGTTVELTVPGFVPGSRAQEGAAPAPASAGRA